MCLVGVTREVIGRWGREPHVENGEPSLVLDHVDGDSVDRHRPGCSLSLKC